MLGEKLKELREAKGLLQRQVAAQLEVDTAYVSKMENDEKPVSRAYLKKLSPMLGVTEKELATIWLADKVLKTVDKEDYKQQALLLALKSLK